MDDSHLYRFSSNDGSPSGVYSFRLLYIGFRSSIEYPESTSRTLVFKVREVLGAPARPVPTFRPNPTTMLSNAPSMPLSKGTSIFTQLPSPSQSQATSTFPSADRQRRSGSSFGAAASSRAAISSPRNNQSRRKQNKDSRRPKLGYEDMSEAAAIRSTSSRKGQTSITHLMNFSLPPRPTNQFTHIHDNRSSGGRRSYNWGYNAVDKAR